MADPSARQAAALAAVDRKIDLARSTLTATGGKRWEVDGCVVIAGHPTDEVLEYTEHPEHIATFGDPSTVIAQLEGRRRTLVRHAPVGASAWYRDEPRPYTCARCGPSTPWECEDWRDAAAGLDLPPCSQDLPTLGARVRAWARSTGLPEETP